MAPALGLGLLLGLLGALGDPGGATKVLHSLHYLKLAVSEPSPGVPQYMSIGFVDGIPFTRYDSERGWEEPLTQWIKDGAEPEYWEEQTQINERNQNVAARSLETLQERYNQSGGFHTIQWLSGCDLLSDGSVHGSQRAGYDGRDFISFDLEYGRFVAADSAAEITRRRWEQEEVAEGRMNYLKHVCPEWLRKYVGYGQKELERKEPPDVHVSGKEEHGTLILSCHAYGFYPNTITVSWMKGDDTLDQETERGGIVPNSDGTFHTWARIEALPEEREQYRCRVEHPGMPEPGIFAWEPTSGGNLTVVVAVSVIAAILILIIVLIGFGVWKLKSGRRDWKAYKLAAGKDVGTNSHNTVL
ncbi:class I histocompatibility antigen, F10 alpha chain-like isoform X4 [Serinus canaria]|uniref:class I histocompatibility antigen, F10 alpha chain-like isoform X4 n=1 Tax=Serinus canaria TaxID=9135 RepID=UPI0021CC61E3|nr:class I histocompatibility antigen, F10 alpha chain-like isoform X4 [Serinus canaria]